MQFSRNGNTKIFPGERWDIYNFTRAYDSHTHHYPKVLTTVASNIPTITIDDLMVNGDDIIFSWHGEDKTIYDNIPTGLPSHTDLTVFLGPTTDPDLIYRYRIEYAAGGVYQDWISTSGGSASVYNILTETI